MKRLLKKGLALLLTAVLMFGGVPFASFAQTDFYANVSGTTHNEAVVTWTTPVVGANYAFSINDSFVNVTNISPNSVKLTGLTGSTTYSGSINMSYTQNYTATYDAYQEDTGGKKLYYYFFLGEKIYVDAKDITGNGNDTKRQTKVQYNANEVFATAQFSFTTEPNPAPILHTVKFFVDGEQVGVDQLIEHGKDAIEPVIESREGYTFAWDKTFTNVTGNLDVNGNFTPIKYTVKFFVGGEQEGEDQLVEYGKDATAPVIDSLEGHTFAWDKSFTNVKGNLEVNGIFTPIKYTVKFFVGGEQAGEDQLVEYGKDATAPVIDSIEGHTFAWDKSFTNVKGNLEVNGIFTPIKYTVKFFVGGEQAGEDQLVEYGKDATAPVIDSIEGHTFAWDKSFTNVKGNLEVNGIFTPIKYTVKFFVGGEQEGEDQLVEYGKDATAPVIDSIEGYTFAWDKSFTNVTGNLDVNGNFTPIKYTVKFFVGGEQEGEDQLVEYGKDASAPVIDSIEGYTFAWDKSFTNVIGNLEVNGIFTPIKYTVKFFVDGEQAGEDQLIEYGKDAIAPEVDSRDGYTFAWDKSFTNVTNNLEIMGIYTLIPTPTPPTPTPPTPTPPTPTPTEPTEDIDDEPVAQGAAIEQVDVDQFLVEPTFEEVVEVDVEDIPLGPSTLPQTGQLPAELFYGIGGLITAAGAFMKRKK